MQFTIPTLTAEFEIPDEWWTFAEMETFSAQGGGFYPYHKVVGALCGDVEVVPITDVEPPMRNAGIPPFKKHKLVPVLCALLSPEGSLPPIEVTLMSTGRYRFKVRNGYHRYYVSAAVGFDKLPVVVC